HACSLASSALVHTCREVRFHSITLRAPTSPGQNSRAPICSLFLAILEFSPDVAKYVHKVRILNPQSFTMILPKLTNVTEALIWSDPLNYEGVLWSNCPWIREGINSLPSLQTITTENFVGITTLNSASFFKKIRGLALFYPDANSTEAQEMLKTGGPPLSLSTFRLRLQEPLLDGFLASTLIKCFDISQLRHLALGKPLSPSPMGSWLLGLNADGKTAQLESLVIELEGTADTVMVPPSSFPKLKRIWLSINSRFDLHTPGSNRGWEAWLSNFFEGCVQNMSLEVTFFLPAVCPPELEQLVYKLRPFLERHRVLLSFASPQDPAPDHDTSTLPAGWARSLHTSEHCIWTAFYEL
ncbi:hypothetical protein DL96DRAFT_1630862, partial [Flagelloscypha sp. PMI_526]